MSEDRRVEAKAQFFLDTRPDADGVAEYEIGFDLVKGDFEKVWVDGRPYAKFPDGALRPYIDDRIRADREYAPYVQAFDEALRRDNEQMAFIAMRSMVTHMQSHALGMRGENALQAIKEARELIDAIDDRMDQIVEWELITSLAERARTGGATARMGAARGKGIEWSRSDSRARGGA